MTRKMLFRRAVAAVAKEETVKKPKPYRCRCLRRELRGIVRKAGDYCSPWEQSDIAEAALAPRRRAK